VPLAQATVQSNICTTHTHTHTHTHIHLYIYIYKRYSIYPKDCYVLHCNVTLINTRIRVPEDDADASKHVEVLTIYRVFQEE